MLAHKRFWFNRRPSLKIWHCLLFLVVTSFIVAGFFALQKHYDSFFYVVTVEGEEVGLVRDPQLVEEFIAQARKEAAEHYGVEVVAIEEVALTTERRLWEKETPLAVQEALKERLSFKATGYMVMINNQPILAVPEEADVQEVIALLRSAYAQESDGSKIVDVSFEENVTWAETLVPQQTLKEPGYVADILLRGTDRREVYLVSRGDTLWDIARQHDLSVDELRLANPQVSGELIKPGEELELIVAEPKVNITVVEEVTVTERIPFGTRYTRDGSMWRFQTRVITPGEHGEKEVTYLVTRENNREVQREKIKETILREPVERVVAAGVGSIPSRGTGRFDWPVYGGGIITRNYHRGHRGIDISVAGSVQQKKSTPILAADSGVVVHSGHEGNFGLSIVIYHGGGQNYFTRYAHNSRNLVSAGDEVRKGQIIAYMGNTGRTRGPTGVHLHFEVRRGGKFGQTFNPLNYFVP